MKKLISAVLAFVLFTSLITSAVAIPPPLDNIPSDWAVPSIHRTKELSIHPEVTESRYREPLSRAGFCEVAVLVYEKLSGSEISERVYFSDTDDINVEKMAGIGVVQGFGGGIFDPHALLTREQGAVIISSLMKALGAPLPSRSPNFTDSFAISSWASEQVGEVWFKGIMLGVGSGYFDPQGSYTFEQSLITLLRVYDAVSTPAVSITDPSVSGKKIPILMYHSVLETPTTALTELFVRPSEMEKQLIYLRDNGYQTITFEDLDNIGDFTKPIMLTFDDGYRDNYTVLFPLLKKYNMKATIFMISDAVYSASYLNHSMLREMSNSGLVSIQSHTVNHIELGYTSNESTIRHQLNESRRALETITGRPIVALAYPNGSSNGLTRSIVPQYYKYALNKDGGVFRCGEDLSTMRRVRISRSTSLSYFATLIA